MLTRPLLVLALLALAAVEAAGQQSCTEWTVRLVCLGGHAVTVLFCGRRRACRHRRHWVAGQAWLAFTALHTPAPPAAASMQC